MKIAIRIVDGVTNIIIIFPFEVQKPKRVCHYQELIDCVSKYTHLLIEFHGEHGKKQEIVRCYCEQNCVYSNIFIDNYQVLAGSTDLLGTIGALAIVNQYPLIRYKRKVLFSLNDLFGELITGLQMTSNNSIFHLFSVGWGDSLVLHRILCTRCH